MNRKDEIIKILEDSVSTITQLPDSQCDHIVITKQVDYEYASKEIEKLFEVEGMVEIIIQRNYFNRGWENYYNKLESEQEAINILPDLKHIDVKNRIIKRTTIDEIIQ